MFAIWKHGSDEQKEEWLPRMATGEAIGCFGLTEPDFGSNPGGMRTRARRDGTDWVLDGTKMWITNGSVADVAVVWARTDDGIRGFVVPTDTDGLLRPRDQAEDVAARVGHQRAGARRGPAAGRRDAARGQGLSGPLSCLTEARFGIIFGALGAARDCLETTIAYAREREIFDKPLAAYQLTQAKLADMAVELGKGMLLALHLGRLKDEGRLPAEAISVGKLNNIREALADRARVPHHPRRRRHHPGVPADAARQQPRVGAHLRGHRRGAPAGDRPGAHRGVRVPLTRPGRVCHSQARPRKGSTAGTQP